jgi:PadR family transcriptional regulator PadR
MSAISKSPASFPGRRSSSRLHSAFFGPNGVRAGWRLLIFSVLILPLIFLAHLREHCENYNEGCLVGIRYQKSEREPSCVTVGYLGEDTDFGSDPAETIRVNVRGVVDVESGAAAPNKGFVTSPCTSTEVVTQCPVEVERETMPDTRIELPQGTLDLLILKTVTLGPQHGWAISERIQQISSDALCVQQGSLYPALHRLERRGWIKAKWGASENNRRAKYYELTRLGHKQLEVEKDSWSKLTAAVARVLESA